jgi:hypothetical protein
MTEAEFTEQVKQDCVRTNREFVKVFAEPEIGQAWRAARDAAWIKAGTFAGMELLSLTPVWSHERDVGDPKTALQQLNDLAAEQKRRSPELSDAQAFARTYTDPKNARLAALERQQSRARLPQVGGKFVG